VSHLTVDDLSAQLDGVLTGAARERAERHLAECEACREALATLAAQEESLRPALEHDPGDAYFETFAARVEDRIRAAGLQGAQARQAEGGLGWLRSPRRVAWVGAVAVTLVGAGVVMLTSRIERPDLDAFEKSQAQRTAPQAAAPVAPPPGAKAESSTPASEERTRTAPGVDEIGNAHSASDRERARLKERAGSFARPPADGIEGGVADETKLDDKLRNSPPQENAAAQESKVLTKDRRDAAPQRLMGSRRTLAGEDVPLQRRESGAAAPPPSAERQVAGTIAKKQATPAAAASPDAKASLAPAGESDRALAPTLQATRAAPGSASLCGRVLDGSGHAVARAQVTLVESGAAVSTGADGRFCLEAPAGEHEISVMAIGFAESRLRAAAGVSAPDLVVTLRAVSVLEGGRALFRGQSPGRAPSLAREPIDVFAALPDSLRSVVRAAQALVREGRVRRSAARLDQAAARWQTVVAGVDDGIIRDQARFGLAEARHLAWQIEPGEARRLAAVAAARAALAATPSVTARPLLQGWLDEMTR